MPYSKVEDLPSGVKDNLPTHGSTIYLNAFNSAKKQGHDDSTAAKIAWSAVENKFHKDKSGKWVSNSLIVPDINMPVVMTEMYITKANLDENGRMVWASSASDTGLDTFEEQMSLQLYKSFLHYINEGVNLPIYLSLAHYPRLGGIGEAGIAEEVFVDGNILKAKGYFKDTPLGRRIYNAIRKERRDGVDPRKRIRISIGFYDKMHRHSNGVVWTYEPNKPCTQCALGIKGKVYLEGILEHLAVTRVPVNKRTDIVVKSEGEKSMTTRYEDALSIVEEKSLVDPIEKANQDQMRTKADTNPGLVEKATAETNELTKGPYGADLNVPDLKNVQDPEVATANVLNGLPKEKLLKLFGMITHDGKITDDELSDMVNKMMNELTDRSQVDKATSTGTIWNGKMVQGQKPEKKRKDPIAGYNPESRKIDDVAGHKEMSEATEDFIELLDEIDDDGNIIDRAEARKDVTSADKKRAVKEYGNVTYADPTNKKYPIDTEAHIRAAWNYINKEKNAAKYGGKVGGIKAKIVAAWKKKIDPKGPPSAEKSDIIVHHLDAGHVGGDFDDGDEGDEENEKAYDSGEPDEDDEDEDDDMDDMMPFGGATSFKEAQSWLDAQKLERNVYAAYSVFGALASNIMCDDESETADKISAMQGLLADFKDKLDPKELMKMSKATDKEEVGEKTADKEKDEKTKKKFAAETKANKSEAQPVKPADGDTSEDDTQPDSVKMFAAMTELITLVRELIGRPASVATTGKPLGIGPKGANDQPLPTSQPSLEAAGGNQGSFNDPSTGKTAGFGPNGEWDQPLRSLVSDFATNLSAATAKTGDERIAAYQNIINNVAVQMKALHDDLAAKEPVVERPLNQEAVNRNLDERLNERLAPIQAAIAELTNIVKSQAVGKAVPTQATGKPVEIPQMKSLVMPTQVPTPSGKGMSFYDIATATTFGAGK